MAIYDNPKIVTNELVLHLDAANIRSYPGSGTDWFDLSGQGNNGTLTNGPTFNANNAGSIVFDGVDDYIAIPHTTVLDSSLSMTLSAWVYITSFVTNMSIFGKAAGGNGYDFRIDSSSKLNLVKYNVTDQPINLATPLSTLTWYNIAAVQSSTKVEFFVNGVSVGSFVNSQAYGINTGGVRIARNRNIIYTPGYISNVYFYNRVLSAAEIRQNFNALRGRFAI